MSLTINDYTFQIDFNFLTNNQLDHLRTFILDQEEFFYNFIKEKGFRGAGQAFYKLSDPEHFINVNFVNRCNLKTFAGITMQLPNCTGDKHIDADASNRRTVLSIPLLPVVNYPPTNFWDNPYSEHPVAQALFVNNNPCLFNVKTIHNVTNTYDNLRANLQFCFGETIEIVRQLITSGNLFHV
jgi:hypothetical protein